jgi:hypothetical protein
VGQVPGVEFHSDVDLPELWHYCVRDQDVNLHIPGSQMPVLEQYWVYGTNMQDVEVTDLISEDANSVRMGSNPMFPHVVDRVLANLVDLGHVGGLFESSYPCSPAGEADKTTLDVTLGWSVSVPASVAMWDYEEPTHSAWVDADLTGFAVTKGVTSGVLAYTNNSYGRIIMRPGARSAGPVYFEVEVDRNEVDGTAGTSNWTLITNCDASGNGGLKCHIQWPTIGQFVTGIQWGPSNTASGNFGATHRVNYNPAGWTTAGIHRVGLYQNGTQAIIYLDGVPVWRCNNASIGTLLAGGYVGVGGDVDNLVRSYQTWGLEEI